MKQIARFGILIILAVCMVASLSYAQVSRTLAGGKLHYYTDSAFATGDAIQWPYGTRGWNVDMLTSAGVDIGVKMTWTDAGGVTHDVKIAEAADNRFTDMVNVVIPVEGAFKRVFKAPPPARVIDGKNWQDITSIDDPVDADIPSDEMIYNHCTTWTDIDIERWTYTFNTDANGDFVILEWLFTNTSNETKKDVYFGLRAQPGTNNHYSQADRWGNYIGAEFSSGVDSLRLYYNTNANRVGDNRDDRADPANLYGNFTKPQYMGFVLVHADKSVDDESDDPNAPHKGGWSQRQLSPDLNSNTPEQIYDFLKDPWDPTNPDLVLWPGTNGLIRAYPPDFDIRTENPEREQEKAGLFSCGPYQMKPGDNVRIVMAYAGGAISPRLAIDAGWAYDPNYEGLRPRRPMPYAVPSVGINKGDLLTKEQKDALISTGLDSMLNNAMKAIRLWNRSGVKSGKGTFDVDFAPPSPSLSLTSKPGFINLEIGDEAEVSGSDIQGYRVYRNYLRPPSLDTPTDTSFVMVKELPVGTREWKDENVARGQNYYYYVTAYNSKGIESSRFLNRGSVGTPEEAVSPQRPPATDWKNSVVVVPNPYHSRGALKFSGSSKLTFYNTPAYCRIHIYTMTGDLVETLYHNEGTGDEDWDRQDTFSTMQIVSGIYLYVVEELDGPHGAATGETAIGKFIVVK